MIGRIRWFNTYLAGAVALLVLATLGCKSAEERKRDHTYTTLWVHLETPEASPDTNHVMAVTIAGVKLNAQTKPFLTDENVLRAAITALPEGGQALRVEFDHEGTLLLDAVTSQNRQRHLLVFSEFGLRYKYATGKNVSKTRWLAAPHIRRRITDGVVVFSVDATSAELDQIVLGLNNAAKRNAKPWVF